MSESGTSTLKISVHLVTPGVGVRDYHLSEGATLADLLRQSATSTTDRAIFVDGLPLEESLPLREGAVVTIVPKPGDSATDEPWRAVVASFRDEALFREYSEILKARRREDNSAEGQSG
jgi:sulfur carrier protein ThiS